MKLQRRKRMTPKRLPIRHIGYFSLCSAKHAVDNIRRVDLGSARYKRLGMKERFKNEKPYRVCRRCIAKIIWQENAWRRA